MTVKIEDKEGFYLVYYLMYFFSSEKGRMMINYKKAIFLSKNVTSFPFARLNLPRKKKFSILDG